MASYSNNIINSRSHFKPVTDGKSLEAEGGCGVVGAACEIPIAGKHFLKSLIQMKNRGNGKGGGISALGLDPTFFNVNQQTLDENYLLVIAYLDKAKREIIENKYIIKNFEITQMSPFPHVEDFTSVDLDVKPPEVYYYFVSIKPSKLKEFMDKNQIDDEVAASDEFMYQNSYALNTEFYASLGEQEAFVLSHGKNMIILKLVGYANQVIQYYKLEEFKALVWIGHHRYPTKGKVWHPGGAHPFIGLNETLVHNGDFANYHAITEYLSQRNIHPLFLTDTEVAVYLFDLYNRVYQYPTEYVIEALAPTTERDFMMLETQKQNIYKNIQHAHLHASPDGPWFFIIGRNLVQDQTFQLLGITDTSMLRPQVVAIQDHGVKIGLVASERQGIDAMLRSLSEEDERFVSKADMYWNARGGSFTDGGAFLFNVVKKGDKNELICLDKFGKSIEFFKKKEFQESVDELFKKIPDILDHPITQEFLGKNITLSSLVEKLPDHARSHTTELEIIDYLTLLLDRVHLMPDHFNGEYISYIEKALFSFCRSLKGTSPTLGYADFETISILQEPKTDSKILLLDVKDFAVEGDDSAALAIVKAYKKGWKRVISFDWLGQRFCGVGLGPNTQGFRIDVYGNPGDYLGSGLDGAEIYTHCSVQDQVGNMIKAGKIVVFGDVGQTFMYGAKGGDAYILGNCAGRPLINAVGNPRVVMNGTALDYLAESFMAGNPLEKGGFVLLNGLRFDNTGEIKHQDTPFAGGNLLSLASGGAIYVLDPYLKVGSDQLNEGEFTRFSDKDWLTIQPYLQENENLFKISFADFVSKYRKIIPKVDSLKH